MFVELMPLLKERTLFITVARLEGKLKVNVIPTKAREGEDQALTTPLSYTGSPQELDAELGTHLASYVDSHVQLGCTLAEAKAEMDAAAKAARQRSKSTPPPRASDEAVSKPESPTSVSAEMTPSLFGPHQSTEETVRPDGAEQGSNEKL